ncbi:hypothetical protein SAMN05444062_101423 [Pseudomonas syringae]|uniref:hypothetical protein n=1 Tax=Pseudomonas syringae TaxID=317 RepID=UPI0008EE427F|nr:hypothetical protein [Pseudomonas syringae]SFG78892.1 hypothetical protein SAMN05444062_101423 [Pseudomonas syringae]
MAAKKPPHPLQASEIERFERNLANWLKLDPSDAIYHRFQGMLESQIATLQICQVITRRGAVKLLMRMGEVRLQEDGANTANKSVGLRLV